MIATIIIILLAFVWLGFETDFMRVRLESTEYQRAAKAQAEVSKIKADMPEDTEPLKPLEFTPLDMPEFTGSLNIVCERE